MLEMDISSSSIRTVSIAPNICVLCIEQPSLSKKAVESALSIIHRWKGVNITDEMLVGEKTDKHVFGEEI